MIFNRLHQGMLIYFGIGLCLAVANPLLIKTIPFAGTASLPEKIGIVLLSLWLISVWYFLGSLLFSQELRNRIVGTVSNIQERDEREEFVTGRAAKEVFLVTLAGFIAVGIWGMSTVNILFILHKEGDSLKTEKAIPFIGMALPVEWSETVHKAWVQQNPGEKLEYKDAKDKFIPIYGNLTNGSMYEILLVPPQNPKLSRIMLLCALLQIVLFKLFVWRENKNNLLLPE